MARVATLLVVLTLGFFAAGPAVAAEEGLPTAAGGLARAEAKAPREEVNTGQDPTRPVTRLDARFKYVELDHKAVGGDSAQILTLRADRAVPLRGDWALALRGDIPMVRDDTPSADNPGGARRFRTLGHPVSGAADHADGRQLDRRLRHAGHLSHCGPGPDGDWKVPACPVGRCQVRLRWLDPRFWTALLVRHAVGVGAVRANRTSINQTIVQPFENFDLPREWCLTFAPEMRYDWREARWFIPFDVEVGKMLTRHVVMSPSSTTRAS